MANAKRTAKAAADSNKPQKKKGENNMAKDKKVDTVQADKVDVDKFSKLKTKLTNFKNQTEYFDSLFLKGTTLKEAVRKYTKKYPDPKFLDTISKAKSHIKCRTKDFGFIYDIKNMKKDLDKEDLKIKLIGRK